LMHKLIEADPDAAKTSIALGLSATMGPEKFSSTFSDLEKSRRDDAAMPLEREKHEADVGLTRAQANKAAVEAAQSPQRLALDTLMGKATMAKMDADITNAARRLSLDEDTLRMETQAKLFDQQQKISGLDEGAKKLVNEATVTSVSAQQSAEQTLDLANRLEAEGGGYGAAARASEWLARQTGRQDQISALRQEYTRLRNSAVAKMLPPGSASDTDIAMALKGFPEESAGAGHLAQFLRGMAKLNQYEAALENSKAEWVGSVGHLGRAKRDVNIAGTLVPAGSTFVDFTRAALGKQVEDLGRRQDADSVNTRSYMKYAR
jgi:hypothetical protein